jgi:hypothetical protein
MDGIIFRTTDGARWGAAGGSGTGGNLTPLQFDENMWELLTRIQAIENDPPEAVGVNGFTVIGSQFQVNMTDGSTRGPYDLPIAAFRDVGIWVNNLPLLVMDFFQVPGRGYYRTLIAHTTPDSPAVFDPNAIDEDSGSPTFGQPLYSLVLGEDASIYDVGFFMPGRVGQGIAVGEEMFAHTFVRDVTLPLDLPGSLAKLAAACAADMELEIYQDTTLQGSVTFAAGETDGVFVWTTAVDFAAGETLSVHPPATLDATARGLKISFKAVRNDL